MSSTTFWAASRLMSLTSTQAPSLANTRAWAAPSPPPAPVMMTTLLSRIPICCSPVRVPAPPCDALWRGERSLPAAPSQASSIETKGPVLGVGRLGFGGKTLFRLDDDRHRALLQRGNFTQAQRDDTVKHDPHQFGLA